ncbi:MAG TPA: DUF3618 domain-containing protein, partial [Noviherbaspirillum sp.]
MRDDYEDNRRPEEIESDIERTRAEMSSTIDAIQDKLTPGQMMDQALQYARTSLPADFGSNLGAAVRENPVPVALIGVGIAWMMAQSRQQRMRTSHAYSRDFYESEAGMDYDPTYVSATADTGPSRMERAKDAIGDAKSRVSESVSGTSERLREKASNLREKASDITSRARDAVSGARERISTTASSGRARMSDLSQRSQQQYYRARQGFGTMAEEQPLVLGAIGIAIGALIGSMMPATRREDEMMGHMRDDLLDRAKEASREHAQTLKESARRVAETAKEEAQRVGSEASSRMGASDGRGESTVGGTSTTA